VLVPQHSGENIVLYCNILPEIIVHGLQNLKTLVPVAQLLVPLTEACHCTKSWFAWTRWTVRFYVTLLAVLGAHTTSSLWLGPGRSWLEHVRNV